jgi:hypothetical protein
MAGAAREVGNHKRDHDCKHRGRLVVLVSDHGLVRWWLVVVAAVENRPNASPAGRVSDHPSRVKNPASITNCKGLEVIGRREADEAVHVPIVFPYP